MSADSQFDRLIGLIADLSKRVEEQEVEGRSLRERIRQLENESLHERLRRLESDRSRMASDLAAWLPSLSLGSSSLDALPRYTDAVLYLQKGEFGARVACEGAMRRLYNAFGFDLVVDPPGKVGSWWKRLVFRSKEAMTSAEVTSRLARMEQAIELVATGKPQSEIDEAQASAISVLLQATQQDDGCSLFVGSSIITRWKDQNGRMFTYARTLTTDEMIRYKMEPEFREQLMLERFGEMPTLHGHSSTALGGGEYISPPSRDDVAVRLGALHEARALPPAKN